MNYEITNPYTIVYPGNYGYIPCTQVGSVDAWNLYSGGLEVPYANASASVVRQVYRPPQVCTLPNWRIYGSEG